MKISATILDAECDFELLPVDNVLWRAIVSSEPNLGDLITFAYSDGVITNLVVSPTISTDQGIILERLINAFKEFNDSHQMGFEVEESQSEEHSVVKPYDPEDIRVRPVVFSAYQVHRDILKGKIDLNPDFQRNFVWNDSQKSLLIESMLLKIPLPAFYFAEDKTGRYQVVDGLQRLTVINQFLNNEFKLKNLQYLHHLEGKYFSEDLVKKIPKSKALEEPYDSRVESTQLNINVIEASSPLRVKYDIFYRINTGGRPLNRQEIRNCFATERTRILLKQMATNHIFNHSTGYSVKDTRMDAQELALRFCGFYLFRDLYLGEMNSFLDKVLDKINELSNEVLQNVQDRYYQSLECAYYLFGDYAFRKMLPEHLEPGARRQFLNKAMFITWTVILADYDTQNIQLTPQNEFVEILAEELHENTRLFQALTTGTTDRYNLEFIFHSFSTLLDNYISRFR